MGDQKKTDEGLFPRSIPEARRWRNLAIRFLVIDGIIVVAIVVLLARGVWPLKSERDVGGLLLWVAIVASLAGAGFWFLRKARTTDPQAVVHTNIEYMPPDQQLAASRRALPVVLIGSAALAAWTAYSLNSVESGEARSATVWGPVALVYNLFGYWPAVAIWPVLGGIIAASTLRRIKRLGSAKP